MGGGGSVGVRLGIGGFSNSGWLGEVDRERGDIHVADKGRERRVELGQGDSGLGRWEYT